MSLFDKLLPPGVQVGTEREHTPGSNIFIGGASLDNAVVSYLKQAADTPLVQMSFVIGIQGRGTLNIPGGEFMALLATMTALAKDIAGIGGIVDAEFSETEPNGSETVASQA